MGLSITPHFARDDAHLHVPTLLEGACPQNLTLMYLGKFSRSLIIDSHLNFAKDHSCMIEGTFRIYSPAIKSSTTFSGLSSFPEANFQHQQHSSQQPCLHANDREPHIRAAPSTSGIVRVASNTESVDSENRYDVCTLQKP